MHFLSLIERGFGRKVALGKSCDSLANIMPGFRYTDYLEYRFLVNTFNGMDAQAYP